MAFWKTRTLTEMTVSAVDQIAEDVADLYGERQDALSCFRCTAERLQKINDQLDEKSALCGSLIGQLKAAQESVAQQVSDNEKVREKILEIIGE